MKTFINVEEFLHKVRTTRLIDSDDPVNEIVSIIQEMDKLTVSDEQLQSLTNSDDYVSD